MPGGHAWHAQADCLGLLLQQPTDIGDRYMADYYISANLGGMAGLKHAYQQPWRDILLNCNSPQFDMYCPTVSLPGHYVYVIYTMFRAPSLNPVPFWQAMMFCKTHERAAHQRPQPGSLAESSPMSS